MSRFVPRSSLVELYSRRPPTRRVLKSHRVWFPCTYWETYPDPRDHNMLGCCGPSHDICLMLINERHHAWPYIVPPRPFILQRKHNR